jgi:hypothetical protein
MSNINDIKNTINTIKVVIKNLEMKGITSSKAKEDYFWTNYQDITNKYQFLISHLCSNGDNKLLDIMMEQLINVKTGNKTQADADKEIGQILADKYL